MFQSEAKPGPALDESRQKTAREYARIGRRLAFTELAPTAAILLVLAFSGLSPRLVSVIGLPVVSGATAYMAGLVVCYGLIAAPLDYYRGYVLPHRYGLSIQKLRGWLWDELKSRALTLVFGAGVTALVYWFISAYPQAWWLMAWGVIVIIGVVMAHLAPVLIVPLFLKMKPLADEDLKRRLEELAQRAGMRVKGVYTLELSTKGTGANAALMGTGRTRRIALTDTLLGKYSSAEIEVILAHEMGHHHHGDITKAMVMQAGLSLVGLYLTSIIFGAATGALGYRGISDVAALPLLILIIVALTLVASPLLNTYQRHREVAADEYALVLTGKPDAFVSMMTRLTDQNLTEAQPPRWVEVLMHDHPSYYQRLELARRYVSRG